MDRHDLIWLITMIAAESVAFYCVKKYSVDNSSSFYLFFAVVLFAYIPLALYKIIDNGTSIALVNIIFNMVSMIYGLLIGVLIFNESLSFEQKIGIIIGFIAVILMIWHSKK